MPLIPSIASTFCLLVSALIATGCDSRSPHSPPPPSPFRKVLERDLLEVGLPSGVAVSPDGRWLISLGFSTGTITVYDAATLEVVMGPSHWLHSADGDSVQVVSPHAVATSPDGSFAVVAAGSGSIGLSLPSLQLLFRKPDVPCTPSAPCFVSPRHVVRDRTGESYYLSSTGRGIARLTPSGDLQAFFEGAFITTAMSLTREERELLVVDQGKRLLVLTTPDLDLQSSINLPAEFEAQVVVPLRIAGRAILVGGAPGGETSVDGPLMALPVDFATGVLGSLQVLAEGGGIINLGDGNEWADVGDATAIVPTTAGTVTIDTNLGTVNLHSAEAVQHDFSPCCDIASYPTSARFVIATLGLESTSGPGSLIVYEFDERILSTSN